MKYFCVLSYIIQYGKHILDNPCNKHLQNIFRYSKNVFFLFARGTDCYLDHTHGRIRGVGVGVQRYGLLSRPYSWANQRGRGGVGGPDKFF